MKLPPRILARAVHRALFGLVLAAPLTAVMLAQPAWAQTSVETEFDIPAGPVNSALAQFAATAGVNVSFEPGIAQGKTSPGLHGRYTIDAGLRQLLSGSNLQPVPQASGGYSLLPAITDSSALQLDSTNISGKAGGSASEYADSYIATRSNSASKTDTPLIEIPQSISVVTRQQMQAQGVQTVTEALRYVPGVKVEAYGLDPKGFDWLYIRGFNGQSTSDYLNGLRQQNNSYAFYRSEPYAYERIDVVKGPSSTLFGQGDAGGIINRVSKKPEADHVNEVQLSVGNYDRRQGQFDLGGALDTDQHLLYRLVGSVRDTNTQVDYDDGHEVKDDRLYVAPSFTWAPDEDTSLTLLSDFLHDRNGGSLFAYSTQDGHTTDTLMGDHSFNHFNQDQYSLGYEFRHRFNDTWEFRQNARYGQVDLIFQNLLPFSVDSTGNTIRAADRFDQHMDTFALDNQLQADFNTGPLTHKLLMGADYTWQDADITRWRILGPGLNINNPVYGQSVTRPTQANSISSINYDQTIEQVGAYLQDQIKFDDHWILTAGGRYDYVRNDLDNYVGTSTNQKDNAFTGRLGLTYLTEFGLAPYVSYSESFAPNTGLDSSGRAFDSSEAHQWEVGVKYQPTDAILMTLAAYDLTKTNALTAELVNGTSTGFSVANGEQQSRGIEAEIKARLDQNWDLIASYTYTKAEITKSNYSDKGNRPANVPEHMASTWLNYTFHDTLLSGLSLGGGARYTGVLYGDNANTYHIDNYTLFDAGASYPVNKNVTVSLNAQNLLDEKYVASCDDAYECYPGLRRTLLTSVKYTW
jgi:iron complex outermembrane receptor protein